jgi:Ca-activated chloride channel homolog
VTALYEVVPAGGRVKGGTVDALRYQEPKLTSASTSGELMTLKLRWKAPDGDASELMEVAVRDGGRSLREASADLRFAAAVAELGMLLRGSDHAGGASFTHVRDLAKGALGRDEHGDRAAFLELAARAEALSPKEVAVTQ